MTQEEIEVQAEIYTKEKHCKGGCGDTHACCEYDIEDCCPDCRKTNEDFIAGAKWGIANAIEWHDLREDPNDLPEVKGYYWVVSKDCPEGTKSYYNHSEMEFNDDNIITWCELPQFKDKE